MCSRILQVFLVAALAASAANAAGTKPTVESVGDQVMCSCGCVATMNQCPHKDKPNYVCYPTWQEMKAEIQKESASGKDETAILQALAIRYGVQVLAAPPAQGFNLTVWILPGIGLLAGLGVVVVLVRRWRRRPAPPDTSAGAAVDPKLLAEIEEEMKKVAG